MLREAALRGSVYVHWPNDRPWLEQIEGIGDPLRRLQGMKKRGSLAPIARGRWIKTPPGASTVSQAAPPPILLAALLDGRAEWYLGFLSALIHHGLTDIDSETLCTSPFAVAAPDHPDRGRAHRPCSPVGSR